MSRLVIALSLLALVAIGASATLRMPSETPEQRVERLASELRCPVCQALSVRDSPSETARAMRDVVAQRVAEGRSDQEIRDEFRAAYGDWILLSPPPFSWDGLLWLAPLPVLAAGAWLARSRLHVRGEPEAPPDPAAVAALRERVATEEALDA